MHDRRSQRLPAGKTSAAEIPLQPVSSSSSNPSTLLQDIDDIDYFDGHHGLDPDRLPSPSNSAEASRHQPPRHPRPVDPKPARPQHLLGRVFAVMSKAPLLLRSAPGFGTGSYGAVPVVPADSTNASDDDRTSISTRAESSHGSRLRKSRSIASHLTSRSKRSRRGSNGSENGISLDLRDASSSQVDRGYDYDESDTDFGKTVDSGVLDGRAVPGPIPSKVSGDDESGDEAIDIDSDDSDPPDNSAYPEVRASVSATDNLTLSINTPRMWFLSMFFAVLGSAVNLLFSLRYPSVTITPVIALLLVHPAGKAWDSLLKRPEDPEEEFTHGALSNRAHDPNTSGSTLHRLRLWLAQGRWNEKEHTCVYISSNVSFGFAFATDVIVEQEMFYKQKTTIPYQILLTLSTQILGYTFAGLARRFLVRPGGMIWPGTLMSAAMFNTLHKEENKSANGWTMTRWKFFIIIWASSFAFYFLPGLLFPALSYFNVITWFAPDNVVVANLFGVRSGLGFFPMTFDWAQIAFIGSPLLSPFWASLNVLAGLVSVMWILAPILYYCNVLFSSYMPILSSDVFDNTGKVYDVNRILTKEFLFDKEAYKGYSRVYLPVTYFLSYGLQFAAMAALITHTFCWHGRDIWKQWKRSLREVEGESKGYQPVGGRRRSSSATIRGRPRRGSDPKLEDMITREDVHNRLMKEYPDAPISWYLITCLIMTAVGMFVVEYYPIHLPWYGLLLALGICTLLFIPIGIVTAITNHHSSIYLICQLICGAVFPGRPVANMVFVMYGYISSTQGLKFSADLKLGHYMKIPPRILFSLQMVATVVASLTQIAVLNWMLNNVQGICTPEAVNGFMCPIAKVHFNGSILWGVVGPADFFGSGGTYHILVWCFLLGTLAPIALWLYSRKKKDSFVRKINLPLLFGSVSWIPPATGLNFSVWAIVCYTFNYRLKRRAPDWWGKYTMTLSAALDSGLAFGVVVAFFGLVYPGVMDGFSWWGTEIYKKGCDWAACSFKNVPEGSHFGPDKW